MTYKVNDVVRVVYPNGYVASGKIDINDCGMIVSFLGEGGKFCSMGVPLSVRKSKDNSGSPWLEPKENNGGCRNGR